MFTKSTITLAIIVGITSGALAATTQWQQNPNPTWDTYTFPPKQAHQSANPLATIWQDPVDHALMIARVPAVRAQCNPRCGGHSAEARRPKRAGFAIRTTSISSQPNRVLSAVASSPYPLAQPLALGRKVSDEFTVPLCRIHHRELHRVGNELKWWEGFKIDPLGAALSLWQHANSVTVVNDAPV